MAARRRNARRQAPTLRQRMARLRTALLRGGIHVMSLGAMVLVILVLHAAYTALRSLPVERIVVSGKLEHLRQEAVREALATELTTGLLFLDLAELRAQLETLPWVYRAELRRRFPGTLEVRVVEQLPIARWGDEAFLNHEAVVIPVADAARWQDLPTIRGPRGSEARLMNHYRVLRDALAPLRLHPRALEEDEFGQLQVQLANGTELFLGDRDFSGRLQRFLQLWHDELQPVAGTVQRVDLRYDGGAAVAFEEPAQLAGLITDSEVR